MRQDNGNLRVPTSEQARVNGAKGGKASAEARAKKKQLKELLELALEGKVEVDGKKVTRAEEMVLSLIRKASTGDVQAFVAIRDTIGEKPTSKVDVSTDAAVMNAYMKAAEAIKTSGEKHDV